MNFMDPQLRPVLDKNSIEIPGGSGGGNLQSIGNGRYAVTLPDGTERYFKIEGTVANNKATAKTPAFDPAVAVAKYEEEQAEKARKAEEKAQKDAEKAKKAKSKAPKAQDAE